jgi:2-desacetyl-2-hydroxyethyl bacteriochlorophyllide A dehydrogenase
MNKDLNNPPPMNENPTIVFPEPEKVILENRSRPAPTEGKVLIQTHCTLISTGTELTMLSGKYPPNSFWDNYTQFPVTPGYCNIGTVIELGAGVDPKWLGLRVGSYGGHAKYVVEPADQCRVVHRDIPDEQAVFFTLGEIVMNGVRRSKITWGESAAVYGLGLLGQLTIQMCHLAGARPIFGVDVTTSRLERLPNDPAVIRVNPTAEPPRDVVERVTRNRMADVVFEVTGNPKVIPQEFEVLRDQGRLLILSSPTGETTFDFHDLCCAPSYTIIGSHNFSHPKHATPDNPWTNLRDAELFFDLVADGALKIKNLISHRASYTEACDLYLSLVADRSQAMGVILDWRGQDGG